jgi:hypothetical protein
MDEQTLKELYKFALGRGWHLIEAKWSHRGKASLLSHSVNVMGIAERLAELEGLSEKEKKLACLLAFLHDIGKEHPKFRNKKEFTHKDLREKLSDGKTIEEVVIDLLERLGLSEDEINSILDMLPYGAIEDMNHFECMLEPRRGKDFPKVRRIVHEDADRLASLKRLEDVERHPHLESDDSLKLTYHSVNVVRGILTSILHRALHRLYEDAGWHPIVFFPEGTIYVGKDVKDLEKKFDDIEEYIARELRFFIHERSEDGEVGRKAVGVIVQTVIPAPEYLYISEHTVRDFWDAIRQQRSIDNPNVERISGISESEAKELIGLYNLLIYLTEVVKQCTDDYKDEIAKDVFKKAFESEFPNVPADVLECIISSKIANTKPIDEKMRVAKLFRNGLETKVRERLLDDVVSKFKNITNELRGFGEKYYGIDYDGVARELMKDISYPCFKVETDVWDAYIEGKKRGTPLCILCSNRAETEAIASIVGKAESFTNFMRGGSKIGGGNKYRICSLCELESKLRSLSMSSKEYVEYYLIPQISISPLGMEEWEKIIELRCNWLFNHDLELSDLIINDMDRFNNRSVDVLVEIRENAIKRKNVRRRVENALKSYIRREYGGDVSSFLSDVEVSSLDEAVDKYLKGELDITTQFDYLTLHLITPNYVMMSHPKESDREDANYLRYLFRMLLMSRLFGASVILKEIQCEPLTQKVSKGAVYVGLSLGLKKALDKLGIRTDNGWVGIEDTDKALLKLSAIIQLFYIMRGVQIDKKGLLLEIVNNPPGRVVCDIVNALQKTKKFGRNDILKSIKLLNLMEETV